MVSNSVSYDAGKKTKGRRRFMMVDILVAFLMRWAILANIASYQNCFRFIYRLH
jgi:hypothetical protein